MGILVRLAAVLSVVLAVATVARSQAEGEREVRAESRIEVRSEAAADGEPKVRVWINGEEVDPGEARIRLHGEGSSRLGDLVGSDAGEASAGAWLGVSVAGVPEDAEKPAEGARVTDVVEGGPAAQAGLKPGDIITGVDGAAIRSPEALVACIRDRAAGDKVRITYYRDGSRERTSVTLGARVEARSRALRLFSPDLREGEREGRKPEASVPEGGKAEGFMGVVAAELPEEMKRIAGTDEGVLVNGLTDESPASQAGLMPGDVIVTMNGAPVRSPAELVARVRSRRPGEQVAVVYYRMGSREEATVRLGRRPSGEEDRPRLRGRVLPEPWAREYFERLRPELKEYMDELRDRFGQDRAEGGEFWQRVPPEEWPDESPERERGETYDVGKDVGRILERLEGLERRLDELGERLERLEQR